MEYEIKIIDDFLHLFDYDKTYTRLGNDFKALIIKSFKDCDSLIFALVETVTIDQIDVVGDSYVYSPFSEKWVEDMLKRYEQIIDDVKNKFNGGVSSYRDWYNKKSYMLTVSNKVKWELTKESRWGMDGKSQSSKRNRLNYAYKEGLLPDEHIRSYIEYYAKLLHEDDTIKLKQYPYYTIIVRPITVHHKENFYPLGNIYLHFATNVPKDEKFYANFLNQFLLVWIKNKGGSLVDSLLSKEDGRANFEANDYLPELGKKGKGKLDEKIKGASLTYRECYKVVFEDEKYVKIIDETLSVLGTEFILSILAELKLLNNKKDHKKMVAFLKYEEKVNSLINLKDNIVIGFIQIMIKRNITHLLFILFNWPVKGAHAFIKGDNLFDRPGLIPDKSSGTFYSYFWTLWISIDRVEPDVLGRKTRLSLMNSASIKEQVFIRNCLSFINMNIDPLKINAFNEISLFPLTPNLE